MSRGLTGACLWFLAVQACGHISSELQAIDNELLAIERKYKWRLPVRPFKVESIRQVNFVKAATRDMYYLTANAALQIGNLGLYGQGGDISFYWDEHPIGFEKNGVGLRKMADRAGATPLDIVCYLSFLTCVRIEDGKRIGWFTEIDPATTGGMKGRREVDGGFRLRRAELEAKLAEHVDKSWLANAYLGPRQRTRAGLLEHMERAYNQGVPPLWAKYLYGNLVGWQLTKTNSAEEVTKTLKVSAKYLALLQKNNVYLPSPTKKKR